MKLSNNAIKFLMAHYRAIYKHAFFKGLTTATILTIGLSAAQGAFAAPNDANLEADDTLPKTENSILTIDGKATKDWDTTGVYQNIKISKDAAKDAFKDYTINITGGAASTDGTTNNFIAGSGSAATNFTAKQLIIDTKDDAQGLTVRAASGQTASATFNKVEVKSGLLQVNAADTAVAGTISANTIDVGTMPTAQEPNAPQAKAKTEVAKVVVGKSGSFGTKIEAKKLSELTTLNIGTNGVVSSVTPTNAAVDNIAVHAAELNLKGGTLQAVSGGSNGSTVTVNIVKGALDSGSIKVEKASTANITFSDAKVTGEDTKELDKSFALKGGKLDVAGTLAFSGAGLVSLAKETEIAGSGELKFIKTNLETDVNTLAAAAGKAKVSLDSGSLVLTDDSVDLSKLTIAANADLASSKIGVTNNTKLKAKNELIVKADNAQLGSLEARKLVLGDKAAATFAKGLSANESVTLMGKVTVKELTLDNGFAEINKAKGAKVTAQDLLGATPGSIESQVGDAGELVVDDSAGAAKLTIANGSWVGNTKLTLGGSKQQGNLVIGATDQSNKTAAKLELGENAKLVMTSGDITIGNTTPKSLISAELDLSKLDKEALTLDKGAIKIQDKGTLVANQDFVEALTSSAKDGVSLTIGSGGVFDVKGEVALDAKEL